MSTEEISDDARRTSEWLKRNGFEAGEPVLETDVQFNADQLVASLRSGGDNPTPVQVTFVNSNVTLTIHVDSVTKVVKSHERSEHGRLPGYYHEPTWRFEGWMIEFDPQSRVVRVRGYIDHRICQVQRIPREPDPDGLVVRVDD